MELSFTCPAVSSPASPPLPPSLRPKPGDPAAANPRRTGHDFTYFRELVRDHVTAQFGPGDKQNYRLDTFPGPPLAAIPGLRLFAALTHCAWWHQLQDAGKIAPEIKVICDHPILLKFRHLCVSHWW